MTKDDNLSFSYITHKRTLPTCNLKVIVFPFIPSFPLKISLKEILHIKILKRLSLTSVVLPTIRTYCLSYKIHAKNILTYIEKEKALFSIPSFIKLFMKIVPLVVNGPSLFPFVFLFHRKKC